MTRHLLRLIWNRKRQNFLLTVEIFFSFLTLFGVVLIAMHYANNARLPLGYEIDRVWSISVDRKESDSDPAVRARHRETYRLLLQALREMPEVETAAGGFTGPYVNANWETATGLEGGGAVRYGMNNVTDDYQTLFSIPMAEGRWFSREDDGAGYAPVVLNRRMAREIFGDAPAVGEIIREDRSSDRRQEAAEGRGEPPPVKRVVGVIDEFRQGGELSAAGNYLFQRMRLDRDDPGASLPERIFVRLAPGTTAAFEEPLVTRAMAVAGDWSFEIETMEAMRESKLRQYIIPLVVVGTVAAFLLMMVGLGLTGVVWQSVTQRIREFGLRRAKGATIPNVRAQVLTELVIMTSLALAAGVALVAQLPLLPLPPEVRVVPPGVFVLSVLLSAAAIYLLTLACGWYPSRLATRVQPAEALHYE